MKKKEKVIELTLFIFIFLVYAFSVSNTITFWDSAEFITSSHNLQASHPPGAPFYTLFSNFILLFFPASWAAIISNLISVFFGALTIVLLYKITRFIAYKILEGSPSKNNSVIAIFAGLGSALTLSFSTTFWTVSTEAEVYTMSSFLLLLVFYLMLLWNASEEVIKSRKILLGIAFLLGLSIGVHLINLSIIIPLSILCLHKKKGLDWKNVIITLFSSIILFLVIYTIGIQGFLKVASFIDIQLVNNYNWPVNSGLFVLIGMFSVVLFFGLKNAKKKRKRITFNVLLAILFFALGTSSYIMPFLKNAVITPFSNQIATSNDLLKYIQAKQFGVDNIPLLKGAIFNAPLDKDFPFLNSEPIVSYDAESNRYVTTDDGKYSKINYANEFDMFFPRMFSQKPISATGYSNWVNIKGEKITYPVKGKATDLLKPTFTENLTFFKNYQIDWMYSRYLFWNFIGRQNENKGTGDVLNGNWISGVNAFDKYKIGDKSVIPDTYQNDKSNDGYYFLPFILGILGLFALRKNKAYFFTTLIFFLTFGLGIIVYLNPVPESVLVRERDYIFLGSFIVFSLWVGLSIIIIYTWLSKITSEKVKIGIVSVVVFSCAPFQLLAKNWDNHQRKKDNFAYDLGKAYLDSCPKNAILITNGDNFTFPLWYLQEVESYRTDVRVINFDQLNLESYIDKLKYKSLDSEPINFTFSKVNYIEGNPKLFPLKKETGQPADVKLVLEFLNNEKTKINWNGKQQHYIPADVFKVAIDSSKFEYNLFDSKALKANYVSAIAWKYSKDFYALNELMLMDIIQNNIHEKPICFAVNGQFDHYLGLQDFMIHEGFVEVLSPMIRRNKELNPKIVDTKRVYSLLMETMPFGKFNNETEFIRFENREYIQSIVRRNYYFLAQALIEDGENDKAKLVLDKCLLSFPSKTIAYKQFAFALGKLYYRIGDSQKGEEVCLKAMDNVWEELQWITSVDNPGNPILNVKKASKLKEMYEQMINQLANYNSEEANKRKMELEAFTRHFSIWLSKNWPYN
ncbi:MULTISPECIES: DUF2723 domain-containing protein [unclassified Flavobacterium]|uniref:glycosyltransferase family 117 protein n=1 Tax=unclassified Flavobacterium TaxID=196869 RepID=UPI0012924D24|nr:MULTISPECIES: DUF2723 domain-containing protein [unclassified Flavobacterium]MQP51248.1 DUF2723 domain-containing protein [Flavobacterium sp. LMO9]MQP61523.1 DUF2723 domain-containing protein [Flavobacterium sp. LMO6]